MYPPRLCLYFRYNCRVSQKYQSIKRILVSQFSWFVMVYLLQNIKIFSKQMRFSIPSFDLKYTKEIFKNTKENLVQAFF